MKSNGVRVYYLLLTIFGYFAFRLTSPLNQSSYDDDYQLGIIYDYNNYEYDAKFINNVTGEEKFSTQDWNSSTKLIKKLREDLFTYYDRFSKAATTKNAVSVNLTLSILHLDLDYKSSILSINSWLIMQWRDENLTWTPDSYQGLGELYLFDNEIWKPDITVIENDADKLTLNDNHAKKVALYHTGHVVWTPMANFKIYCDVDIAQWPFDSQQCSLILGSFSNIFIRFNLGKNVDYHHQVKELTGGWRLIEISGRKKLYFVEATTLSENFEYTLTIEKTRYNILHSIITWPAFILAVLLLTAFWLPVQQIEKFLYVVTITIISCIFFIFFFFRLPSLARNTPNIVKFYSYLICSSLSYLIASIFLYNMATNNGQKRIYIPSATRKYTNSRIISFFFTNFDLLPTINPDAGSCSNGNEIESEPVNMKRNNNPYTVIYSDLAMIINRLLFIVYFFIILSLFYVLVYVNH